MLKFWNIQLIFATKGDLDIRSFRNDEIIEFRTSDGKIAIGYSLSNEENAVLIKLNEKLETLNNRG